MIRVMEYDAVAAVYIAPLDGPVTVPPLADSPARRLRDALEPIATQGWWARAVHQRADARGLGFMETYAWGRAASLGEPAASVVVSAFGVFEPGMLSSVYASARALVSRDEMLADREAGVVETLRTILGGADVEPLAEALMDAAQSLDGSARPLFSGLRELPVPADPHGRLWRGAEMVREHRGDGHLAACVAAGLDAVSMNVLTELWTGYAPGEYTSTRGYGEDVVAATLARLADRGWVDGNRLTAEGIAARQEIENATDVAQQALVERLGDRLEEVIEAVAPLSDRVVEAQSFPTDPRKRAAG
jgi:hypothetical protein